MEAAAKAVSEATAECPAGDSHKEKRRKVKNEDQCVALFGSERLEERNENRRERLLVRVRESNGVITVMHHADKWDDPIRAQCEGLDLEFIEKSENDGYHAFFEVTDELAGRYGCEGGIYEVSQDAALFSSASVLWIDPDLVLLEYDHDLAYLTPDPGASHAFRLVWQSEWTLDREEAASKPKAKKRSKRRRKKKKRRSKRRRRR